MKYYPILLASLMMGLGLPSLDQAIAPVQAAQLQDGSVGFDHPPVLVDTVAAQSPTTRNGLYYFTIKLPADAGESLGSVTIRSKAERPLAFDLDRTEAFLGELHQVGAAIALQSVEGNDATSIRIVFAQPLPPHTTLTIGLQPSQTPNRRQSYEFSITAIPAVATPASVLIGSGQFNFRGDRYRNYPFWWSQDDIFPFYQENDHRVLFWDLPPEFDIRLRQRREQQKH